MRELLQQYLNPQQMYQHAESRFCPSTAPVFREPSVLQAVEKDNLTWQEKHGEAPQPATPTAAEPVGEGQEGEEENVEEKGEDAEIAPTVGSLTYVMFRSDRRSKTARKEKGVRAAPAVEWASLNDEAKESIVEIVNDRREAIERISHGMRWP